ncbi:hypothetical protein ACFLTC_03385, partial [Chloroflexota bacterium]
SHPLRLSGRSSEARSRPPGYQALETANRQGNVEVAQTNWKRRLHQADARPPMMHMTARCTLLPTAIPASRLAAPSRQQSRNPENDTAIELVGILHVSEGLDVPPARLLN